MTITFENDNDVIVYALEKIISYAREYQYFFVANCTWWIASIYGLENQLRQHIDYLALRQAGNDRAISTTPRDIARSVSTELAITGIEGDHLSQIHLSRIQNIDIQPLEESSNILDRDPLRRTRKGRVNPLPQSKRQLKKARQANARHLKQQAITTTQLAKL